MFSNFVTDKILNSLSGRDDDFGGSIYLGLSSTAPTTSGGGVTEPTDASYKRVLIGVYNASPTWMMGTPSAGTITNAKEIHFNASSTAWSGSYGYAILYNAETGGNLLASGTLTTALTIGSAGIVPTIPVNNLTITITDSN